MTDEKLEKLLERTLKRGADAPHDAAAVERIMKRLAGPLPRQQMPFWRWPTVLLDWQFAPAWPRVAALACCAMLGFFIGMVGVDRTFDRADAASSLALFDEGDGVTGVGP
jgi:hypothetical protein